MPEVRSNLRVVYCLVLNADILLYVKSDVMTAQYTFCMQSSTRCNTAVCLEHAKQVRPYRFRCFIALINILPEKKTKHFIHWHTVTFPGV